MSDFYADQARAQQRADRIRASQHKHNLTADPDRPERPAASGNLLRVGLISFTVLVTALVLLLSAAQVDAQTFEPGEGEFFPETMLALRLGNYYYITGEYEKAIEYLTEAVESLPAEVYEMQPAYAYMYRMLGDAQAAAGLLDEADASYALYTDYTGNTIDEGTTTEILVSVVDR